MTGPKAPALLPQIAFMIGMGRSGTTMLTNMLNSHPGIIATPENEFVLHAYSTFLGKDFNDGFVTDSFINMFNHDFNRVISVWKPGDGLKHDISELAVKKFPEVCKLVYLNYPLSKKSKTDVTCVIDKNPAYSLHVHTIHKIFPSAKYIVIVRDYRDNILSRKKYSDQNTPILKLVAAWNYYYDTIFKNLNKYDIKYHLVKYEDLAANPTETLKELCTYLNVSYSDDMLHFQKLSKEMMDHALESVSEEKNKKIRRMHTNLEKKVNTDRVNAYKNELSSHDISTLDYACHAYADLFGYKYQIDPKSVRLSEKIYYRICYTKVAVYTVLSRLFYRLPMSTRLRFRKGISSYKNPG